MSHRLVIVQVHRGTPKRLVFGQGLRLDSERFERLVRACQQAARQIEEEQRQADEGARTIPVTPADADSAEERDIDAAMAERAGLEDA